jgi:hypothetical protein
MRNSLFKTAIMSVSILPTAILMLAIGCLQSCTNEDPSGDRLLAPNREHRSYYTDSVLFVNNKVMVEYYLDVLQKALFEVTHNEDVGAILENYYSTAYAERDSFSEVVSSC